MKRSTVSLIVFLIFSSLLSSCLEQQELVSEGEVLRQAPEETVANPESLEIYDRVLQAISEQSVALSLNSNIDQSSSFNDIVSLPAAVAGSSFSISLQNIRVYQMKISPNAICNGGSWVPFQPTQALNVHSWNQENFYSIQFRDPDLLVSSCEVFSTEHDGVGPVITIRREIKGQPGVAAGNEVLELQEQVVYVEVSDQVTSVRSLECFLNGSRLFCEPNQPIAIPGLGIGEQTFSAIAKDSLGNESQASVSWTVKIGGGNVACDPFSAPVVGQQCLAGIGGRLFFAKQEDRALGNSALNSLFSTVQRLMDRAIFSDTRLLLTNLDVRARSFTEGFLMSGGQVAKDDSGNTLFEWFGMELFSQISLRQVDEEGRYQFVLVSDDGANLDVQLERDGQWVNHINNDGVHATRVGCAAGNTSIELVRNSRLPVRVRYYQGPRQHIAVSLFWRKLESGMERSRYCGFTKASFGQSDYQNLFNEGFKPLSPQNFTLIPGL